MMYVPIFLVVESALAARTRSALKARRYSEEVPQSILQFSNWDAAFTLELALIIHSNRPEREGGLRVG